jgi:xanthosine utilization system XapX-like protein
MIGVVEIAVGGEVVVWDHRILAFLNMTNVKNRCDCIVQIHGRRGQHVAAMQAGYVSVSEKLGGIYLKWAAVTKFDCCPLYLPHE